MKFFTNKIRGTKKMGDLEKILRAGTRPDKCPTPYEYYCQTASPILRFVDSISFDLHGLVARTAALIPRKAELHNLMSLLVISAAKKKIKGRV